MTKLDIWFCSRVSNTLGIAAMVALALIGQVHAEDLAPAQLAAMTGTVPPAPSANVDQVDHRFDHGTVTLVASATASNWMGSFKTERTLQYKIRTDAKSKGVIETHIFDGPSTNTAKEKRGTLKLMAAGQIVPSRDDLLPAATAVNISPAQYKTLLRGESVTGQIPLYIGPGQICLADATVEPRGTDSAGSLEVHISATSGAPWNLKMESRAFLDRTGLPLKGTVRASLDMGGAIGSMDVDGTLEQVASK